MSQYPTGMVAGMLPTNQLQDVVQFRSGLPEPMRQALAMPFNGEDVRQDAGREGDTFVPRYIPIPAVIRRLNDVLGTSGWSFNICSWQVVPPTEVIVQVRLTIHVTAATRESWPNEYRSEHDAIGQAMLKYDAQRQRYWDFGKDIKAAASDGLRKAATQLGVGLHLYERDESMFQGYQPLAQVGHAIQAQPFQVQQIRELFAARGLRDADWCAQLGIPHPDAMSAALVAQILSGAHPVAARYQIVGAGLRSRET